MKVTQTESHRSHYAVLVELDESEGCNQRISVAIVLDTRRDEDPSERRPQICIATNSFTIAEWQVVNRAVEEAIKTWDTTYGAFFPLQRHPPGEQENR